MLFILFVIYFAMVIILDAELQSGSFGKYYEEVIWPKDLDEVEYYGSTLFHDLTARYEKYAKEVEKHESTN